MNWPRVNRQHPCAICGKIDWCTFNERGSGCMRVESQVQMGNGGWWHPNNLSGRQEIGLPSDSSLLRTGIGTAAKVGLSVHPAQTLDCESLLLKWQQSQNGQLEPFAATLGVSTESLRALGCVWAGEHRAFAFPMVDTNRRVIGIRLRNERAEKWAVKGSRSGLFMNQNMISGTTKDEYNVCLIVEGPTDTAAAIDLGFAVIGRPACLGCESMIVQVAKGYPRVPLFIIADSDVPGQRGAAKLQEKLRKAKIVTLPAKDLRAAVQQGLTRKLLNEILNASV